MNALPEIEEQSFSCSAGYYVLNVEGVHFIGQDKDGEKPWIKLCSALVVSGKSRDITSGVWGRLLEWIDDDGNPHQWLMPQSILEGDGLELRQKLASEGLHIEQHKAVREHLAGYIKACTSEARVRSVDQPGWAGDVYVTPCGPVGEASEKFILNSPSGVRMNSAVCGDLADWRTNISLLAQGNSRLMLAICAAFAGPLLELSGIGSGGFHLRGPSSSGKTTALKVAASVWGNPKEYVKLWRSTDNAMEGLASQHNDGLLILDEIGQIDPARAGEVAYMLANGQGKARANRYGHAQPIAQWRTLFLSSGEESLSGLMARAGKKSTVGQEIRLADIDADAGKGMGIIEALHDCDTSSELIGEIQAKCERCYGAVGIAWLEHLVAHREGLVAEVRKACVAHADQLMPLNASGQVKRVAHRFALLAFAGELASTLRLTGWDKGEAFQAVRACFDAWIDGYGGTSDQEDRRICDQVMAFLEMHGSSRFQNVKDRADFRVPNRVGFFRSGLDGSLEFLVLASQFNSEVCQGLDVKRAKKVLAANGTLIPGMNGNLQTVRLPGLGCAKVYVLKYLPQRTKEDSIEEP